MEIPEETEVLADKGYCSQDKEEALQERNLVSRIMQKKKKNHAIPEETKLFNYSVSTQRYRVERSFGGLKKHFGWGRSINMGLQKTADYLFMEAIAFNLKRSLKILRAWDRRGLPRFWEQTQEWLHKRGFEGLKHKYRPKWSL